jgi:natural product precursor
MKSKKIKLQLNKETIAKLNDLEMGNLNGGNMLFSSAFWCVDSKCVCAPPNGTNVPPPAPGPNNDSICDAGVCASAHSILKGTGCLSPIGDTTTVDDDSPNDYNN